MEEERDKDEDDNEAEVEDEDASRVSDSLKNIKAVEAEGEITCSAPWSVHIFLFGIPLSLRLCLTTSSFWSKFGSTGVNGANEEIEDVEEEEAEENEADTEEATAK